MEIENAASAGSGQFELRKQFKRSLADLRQVNRQLRSVSGPEARSLTERQERLQENVRVLRRQLDRIDQDQNVDRRLEEFVTSR